MLFGEPPFAASAGFVSDHISRNYRFELTLLLVNASSGRFVFAVSTNQDLNRQARLLVALEREQQPRSLPTTVQHVFQRSDDTDRCREASGSTPTRARYFSAVTAIRSSSTRYFQRPGDTARCRDHSRSTPTQARDFSAGTAPQKNMNFPAVR